MKAILPTLSVLGLAQVIILAATHLANRLKGLDVEDVQGFGTSDDEENPKPSTSAEPEGPSTSAEPAAAAPPQEVTNASLPVPGFKCARTLAASRACIVCTRESISIPTEVFGGCWTPSRCRWPGAEGPQLGVRVDALPVNNLDALHALHLLGRWLTPTHLKTGWLPTHGYIPGNGLGFCTSK